ncbi:MAG: 50S ribosomal protein L13 [Candidatus Paceibacterota bacterium]|jgi:large subunit ribosomal protein L13|nr:50S ribosomal protein L13 [Candidatus Paceibacterota bacterium]
MTNITTIYIIDAEGKKLGRVASLAASHLTGKTSPTYVRNAIRGEKVRIVNASKIVLDQKKLEQKTYERYSGYPGGLKSRRMEEVIAKKGYKEIFVKAIYGMVPSNRLRAKIMKNLEVTD